MLLYEQAKAEIHDLAKSVMEQHHPGLRMPGGEFVRLCILMVSDSEKEDEPCLELHGDPAAAVIKAIPYKQRVDKRADAEITIDAVIWKHLSDLKRAALIDHEITHLEIKLDENGFVITDDAGRPKLEIRRHDWVLSGFRSIALRYGQDALEVQMARKFEEDFGADVLRADSLYA